MKYSPFVSTYVHPSVSLGYVLLYVLVLCVVFVFCLSLCPLLSVSLLSSSMVLSSGFCVVHSVFWYVFTFLGSSCDVRDDLRKRTMLVSSLSSVFVGEVISELDCITIMFDSICHISIAVYANFWIIRSWHPRPWVRFLIIQDSICISKWCFTLNINSGVADLVTPSVYFLFIWSLKPYQC